MIIIILLRLIVCVHITFWFWTELIDIQTESCIVCVSMRGRKRERERKRFCRYWFARIHFTFTKFRPKIFWWKVYAREKRLHLLCAFKMNRKSKTGFFPPILFSHLFKNAKTANSTEWNIDKSNEVAVLSKLETVCSFLGSRSFPSRTRPSCVGCKSNANSNRNGIVYILTRSVINKTLFEPCYRM